MAIILSNENSVVELNASFSVEDKGNYRNIQEGIVFDLISGQHFNLKREEVSSEQYLCIKSPTDSYRITGASILDELECRDEQLKKHCHLKIFPIEDFLINNDFIVNVNYNESKNFIFGIEPDFINLNSSSELLRVSSGSFNGNLVGENGSQIFEIPNNQSVLYASQQDGFIIQDLEEENEDLLPIVYLNKADKEYSRLL